jgi:hypothetical protein
MQVVIRKFVTLFYTDEALGIRVGVVGAPGTFLSFVCIVDVEEESSDMRKKMI